MHLKNQIIYYIIILMIQNSYDIHSPDDKTVSEARYYRRLQLLLRALIATCGEALRKCFLSQQLLMKV